jgi:hypothetical protein
MRLHSRRGALGAALDGAVPLLTMCPTAAGHHKERHKPGTCAAFRSYGAAYCRTVIAPFDEICFDSNRGPIRECDGLTCSELPWSRPRS